MPRKERPLRLFFVVMKVFLDRELGLCDEKLAGFLFQHARCHFQDIAFPGKTYQKPAPASAQGSGVAREEIPIIEENTSPGNFVSQEEPGVGSLH